MYRDSNGAWLDRHGRKMVRWCIIKGVKRRQVVCYVMAATRIAALKAARSNGIPLDKTATTCLENSLLESVVLENELKGLAARTVLATRDFCGDERQALRDFCAKNGIKLTNDFSRSVFSIVEEKWKKCQIQAGVLNK